MIIEGGEIMQAIALAEEDGYLRAISILSPVIITLLKLLEQPRIEPEIALQSKIID